MGFVDAAVIDSIRAVLNSSANGVAPVIPDVGLPEAVPVAGLGGVAGGDGVVENAKGLGAYSDQSAARSNGAMSTDGPDSLALLSSMPVKAPNLFTSSKLLCRASVLTFLALAAPLNHLPGLQPDSPHASSLQPGDESELIMGLDTFASASRACRKTS